jgi:hypothetical protein
MQEGWTGWGGFSDSGEGRENTIIDGASQGLLVVPLANANGRKIDGREKEREEGPLYPTHRPDGQFITIQEPGVRDDM